MTASSLPITPPDVITQEFGTPRAVRRGVVAGVVGNMLEWYDFALFGWVGDRFGGEQALIESVLATSHGPPTITFFQDSRR